MQRAPDQWDLKASRVHGEPKPDGEPVNIVAADLSFGTVLKLAFMFAIAQALIGGAVLIVLITLDVL